MAMVCTSVSRVQKWLFCIDFLWTLFEASLWATCVHSGVRWHPTSHHLLLFPCCSGVPFCDSVFLLESCAPPRTCVSHGGCLPSLFALEMMPFGWAAGQRKACFLFDFRRLFCLLDGNHWFMVLWLLTSGHQAF